MTEVMLHSCVTWTILKDIFGTVRQAQREFLPRYLNDYTSTRSASDYNINSYQELLGRAVCECFAAPTVGDESSYTPATSRACTANVSPTP